MSKENDFRRELAALLDKYDATIDFDYKWIDSCDAVMKVSISDEKYFSCTPQGMVDGISAKDILSTIEEQQLHS